jgi:hypothetical protein
MQATTTPPSADPVEILRRLDVESLRARLDQIDAERAGLQVLLRAALQTRRKALREGRGK